MVYRTIKGEEKMNPTQFDSIDSAFVFALSNVLQNGHEVNSRVGRTRECIGAQFIFQDVNHTFLLNKRRKLSPYYACAETLWYLSFTNSIEMIKAYAPQYEKFADEAGNTNGAYGYRFWHNLSSEENQLDLVINTLRKHPNSRQAIVTLWEADDLNAAVNASSKDVPCTLSLQYIIRDGQLHAITTMRSNDAWLGFPYDVFAFTCIQRLIAQALGIRCGGYIHQVGSFHIYEKHWVAARESLDKIQLFQNSMPIWPDETLEDYNLTIKKCIKAEECVRKNIPYTTSFATDGTSEMMFDLVATASHKWQGGSPLTTSAQLLKGIQNVNN